jgi:murein endopeptidase
MPVWLLVVSMTCLACGPGFFAREALPPQVPTEELAPYAEESVAYRTSGLGCSPKGCLHGSAPEQSAVVDDAGPDEGARPEVEAPVIVKHPLKGKANDEIARMVRTDLASLGPMSFGTATRGGLINAVHLPDHERWILVDPEHSWGTLETIEYLATAIDAVRSEFPGSHALYVGDISRQRGGYLRPHLSHQSGKDVDVGYFYTRDPQWYVRAGAYNLDRPRTWALVRALIARTDVRYIFIDRRVQRLLRSYAEGIGEDPAWLESIFDGNDAEPAIIRHEPGHDTHLHVRFYNPIAEETARRCYPALLQHRKLLPMAFNTTYKVKKGDTLIGLAKRYGTTVSSILNANGMQKKTILIGKKYLIPQHGPAGPAEVTALPPRRVPPARTPTGPVAAL